MADSQDEQEDGQPEDDQSNAVIATVHSHAELKAWMKERQVIAWERIADALEQMTRKGTDGEM